MSCIQHGSGSSDFLHPGQEDRHGAGTTLPARCGTEPQSLLTGWMCVTWGRDECAAPLSDVSGSESSACRPDVTQLLGPAAAPLPASATSREGVHQPAYLRQSSSAMFGWQPRATWFGSRGSVLCTARSRCAMWAMQKCKQGWPLPPLTWGLSSLAPWGNAVLSLPLAGDFPGARSAAVLRGCARFCPALRAVSAAVVTAAGYCHSRVSLPWGIYVVGYFCSRVLHSVPTARHSTALLDLHQPHTAQPNRCTGVGAHCWGSACLSTFAQQRTEEVMCLLQNSIWNRGVKRHNIHLWAPRSVCQTVSMDDLADPHHPPSPHA